MTADFSHLKKLSVGAAKTARYQLIEVEGEPTLIGVFAGETNKPYFNAVVKRSTRSARKLRAGKMTAKELEDGRNHDREIFPKFVFKGWEDMFDSAGNQAEFSEQNCFALLSALPDYLFDDVRNFFTNPESFLDDPEELSDAEDAVDLGNS